jgi:1-deoxy-D-xylulose-5-phosphate reductoisomerase
MKRRLALLGATGSIGRSALDLIRAGGEDFEPALFSSHSRAGELLALGREFPGARLALSGPPGGEAPGGIHYRGPEGLLEAIAGAGAELTLNGIAGAEGLAPSLAALRAGSHLALANKETLVMAGPLVLEEARRRNLEVIPVDSEHAAIASLLGAHGREAAAEILLTASGGPFRNYTREELARVSPREALAHPTWKMGPKITVDSATMANKGLEVIEAVRLFGVEPERVRVLIHPQSVVHSLLRLRDGTIYAQLSPPDMRFPIHRALYWPRGEEREAALGELSFDALSLEFGKPDGEKFPLLPLAYEAARRGGLYPAAYNAANEEAVAAFLGGRAGFLAIPRIVGYVLDGDWGGSPGDYEAVMDADRRARERARGAPGAL